MCDPVITRIKNQLMFWGDLSAQEATHHFDEKLEEAIKAFQQRHFLNIDGVIGAKTAQYLNQDAISIMRIIEKNIERLQGWKDGETASSVVVNIPTYQLFGLKKGIQQHQQDVVVGMPKAKTPLITSNMTAVTVNPSWSVPVSIFMRSLYTHILQDPGYLDRGQYLVEDAQGDALNPTQISWKGISKKHFPYRILQKPGPHNALGKIKFNLDNKEAIFLHDTNQKTLFQNPRRALSSGCIRLSRPRILARWVLGAEVFDISALKNKVHAKYSTSLPLKTSMPVVMTYLTALVDDQKGLLISDDPYGYDQNA